jgi:hypothetical protein
MAEFNRDRCILWLNVGKRVDGQLIPLPNTIALGNMGEVKRGIYNADKMNSVLAHYLLLAKDMNPGDELILSETKDTVMWLRAI